jgi:hypothetical protein
VVGSITIVYFSSDVGKILAIFRAGEPAEPQSWWRGREAGGILLVNYSVVGGITIVYFSSDVGKISAIL